MSQKPFGLIVKSKSAPAAKPIVKTVAAFGESDDDEDEMATLVSGQRQSASTIRTQRTAERMHQKAQAEDPDIYDYDSYLEQKEEVKAVQEEEKKRENKGRKEAKYAPELMKARAKRELEKQLRDERKQLKEREEENGQFDDKEVFITSAYKKQLELTEEFKKEQMMDDKFDELTAVGKQKMWQQGFNRMLLETLTADRGLPTTSQSKEEKEKIQKLRRLRESPHGDLELGGLEIKQKTKKKPTEDSSEKPKKSIYSDSENEEEEKKEVKKPVARFDEELAPGLNKPRIAKTRQEQILSRFTPTPESSSESEADDRDPRDRRRHERSRSPERQRKDSRRRSKSPRSDRRRHRSRSASPENGRRRNDSGRRKSRSSSKEAPIREKTPEKAPVAKPKTKQERLDSIKKILEQRNGPKEIEEMRQRYFERLDAGIVPLPY